MALSSSPMWRKTAKMYMAAKRVHTLETTRSRSLNPEEQTAQSEELQQARKDLEKLQGRFRLNVQLLLAILLVVTLVLAVLRSLPEVEGWRWLFDVPDDLTPVSDFAKVLTPFLAISVAIERLLETAFSWFEQSAIALADVLVAPQEALDWVGREYQEAYKATEEAAAMVGGDMTPETLQLLEMTESRLSKAEERLRGWVNAPEYLAFKRALSIWFGLLAGLIIAVLGDLRMLFTMAIPAPRLVDMLITGLVIGAGSGPMHDLIGILQGGKNALSNLAELAKGKPIREAVATIQQQTEAIQQGKREEENQG